MRALPWLGLATLLSACLCGCAVISSARRPSSPAESNKANNQVQYLIQALNASPAALRTLYEAARKEHTAAGRLHRALIRSMPNDPGYDASVAASELRKLHAARDQRVAAVARLRLAQMHEEATCRQKLHDIVVIERRMNAASPH